MTNPANVNNLPRRPAASLDAVEQLLDTVAVDRSAELAIDVGMPYEGDPWTPDSFLVVGSESPSRQNPELRGGMYVTFLGSRALEFAVEGFYVQTGESKKQLATVGMPRYPRHGYAHRLVGINRVKGFGGVIAFDEQTITVRARPEQGGSYERTFSMSQTNYPDFKRVGQADVAYKIGATAAVVLHRKFGTG